MHLFYQGLSLEYALDRCSPTFSHQPKLNPEGGISKQSNQKYSYQSKRPKRILRLKLGDPSINEGQFYMSNQ